MKRTRIYNKCENQPSLQEIFGNYVATHDLSKEVVDAVLKHYHVKGVEVNSPVYSIVNTLDHALSQHNLATREVMVDDLRSSQFYDPMIVFTKDTHIPILIYPKGNFKSYFIDPNTGDHYVISSTMIPEIEERVLTFYHPLPQRKLTLKEYFRYARSFFKPLDALLVLALILAVAGIGLVNPYLLKILTGQVVDNQDLNLFAAIALQISGICVMTVLLQAAQSIINARVSIKAENAIHSALMMRVLSLPTSFFKRYNTGELSSRINSVSALFTLVVDGIFVTGLSSISSFVQVVQIQQFAPSLLLPTLLIVSVTVVFLIITSILQRWQMRRQILASADERGVTYGLLSGIAKIRLTGSEEEAFEQWERSYQALHKAQFNPPFFLKISPAISLMITIAGNILIYYIAAKSDLDSSSYIAFVTSYGILSAALLNLNKIVGNVMKIRPLHEMLSPILLEASENTGEKAVVSSLTGRILIDRLRFRYQDGDCDVISGLTLTIDPGEYVAFVGKTGCGKTTLVKLLLGLETPTGGRIYYDDYDVSKVELTSLRKQIGSVTQNGSLFHADILSNIIIAAPDLGEDEAWEAAKIACIDKDIDEMPMKMKTIISEGQGGISGGQKQRLMIARAIVNKPKILIFDEATSSLDNITQKQISDAISSLKCTRIVIAHRLSTIQQCDRIIYIENGAVAEEGTYDSLLALNGKFKELIDKQQIENR